MDKDRCTAERALRDGAKRLADFTSPLLDARLLLMHATGMSEADLIIAGPQPISAADFSTYNSLIERRLAHEPVAYIIGQRDFWKGVYKVSPDVLIPRPDSETLIELALELRPVSSENKMSILDLGTGSGCLLGALLQEYQSATGLGVDKSPKALAIAQMNFDTLGLSVRANFLQSHWFEEVAGRFDIIVTNPPYIPQIEYESLAPEIREHEPLCALTSEDQGRADYLQLLDGAFHHLTDGGLILLEIGDGHGEWLAGAAKSRFPNADVTIKNDLSGAPRALAIDLDAGDGQRRC